MRDLPYKEVVLFLLLGGIAAGINFFSRIAYSQFFSYRFSVFIAYVTGMVVAFLLFRRFVFSGSGRQYHHEVRDFVLVNLVGIGLVWCFSIGLAEYIFPFVDYTFMPEETAHAIGIMIPAITSYFGHKYLTFKKIIE